MHKSIRSDYPEHSRVILRPERPEDYFAVEQLTFEAFLDMPHSGGNEALLAHKMRAVSGFVPELDFVAEIEGKVVGNILYTKSKVVGPDGEWETLTFGPLSVSPTCQRQGIGEALIRHTLDIARQLGYRAVLIFGHEEYYPRFGFVNAETYGITTADGQNFPAFMALPLSEGALDGVKGKLIYDPVFDQLGSEEAKAFNLQFSR